MPIHEDWQITCPPLNLNCTPQLPIRQYMLYATLIATIAWCYVIALANSAFRAKFKERDPRASKLRRFLLCYVVLMAATSTAALVQDVVFLHKLLFASTAVDISPGPFVVTPRSVPLPLVIFGADSLMVWRCWVLYRGFRHPLNILFNSVLAFLSMSSLGVTVYYIYRLASPAIAAVDQPLITLTMVINFILSNMIVGRLLLHERDMRATLGVHSGPSPFKKAVSICVESCAMIVWCGAVIAGMGKSGNASAAMMATIPFAVLTHICVISPLLLIVRVADGRAHTTTIPSSELLASTKGHAGRIDDNGHSIRFFQTASTAATEMSVINI